MLISGVRRTWRWNISFAVDLRT